MLKFHHRILSLTMSNIQGRWIYDPRTRSMVWRKLPVNPNDLDQAIQKLATQGLAMLAVAGVLLVVRELVRAFQEK